MKKTASRILALIVALSMLLVPAAFAAERNAATVTVGNFAITMGEETLEIPVYLSLSGGVDIEGARGYLTANVSTEEQVALAALSAFENGEIKAYLNGMSNGIVIPLEQLIAMLEEEMGGSLEELMAEAMSEMESSITPEMQASIASLMESAMALEGAEIDPAALLNALKLTVAETGKATVPMFDVEVEAVGYSISMPATTLKAMMDAMGAASPEMNAYITEYFSFMNDALAESGEEMTVEQALEMVEVAVNGSFHTAEEGTAADIVVSCTVEDETIDLPFYFVTLTDEQGTYNELYVDAVVDGEGLFVDVYFDDYADETGAYKNISYEIGIYDEETEEVETNMALILFSSETEDGTTVGLDVNVFDGYSTMAAGLTHLCYNVTETEASTSYDGVLAAYATVDEVPYDIIMDTNLTLSSVPEGELLTFTSSINPLEADDETMEAFASDAMNVLMQGAGVLMQDPTISGLIVGAME
ncbi:MAG: hypothetical protein IJE08_13710 [Clostridia bacterium]|nr:hypothetical protein [Clostridia bacterium]